VVTTPAHGLLSHPSYECRPNHHEEVHLSYEGARLLVDALKEYPAVWSAIGVDTRAEARTLTKLFARLAFQQARRRNHRRAPSLAFLS